MCFSPESKKSSLVFSKLISNKHIDQPQWNKAKLALTQSRSDAKKAKTNIRTLNNMTANDAVVNPLLAAVPATLAVQRPDVGESAV